MFHNIGPRVTRRFEKTLDFTKTSRNISYAKTYTNKLSLKISNIYIKPHFKPFNTYDNLCFEAAYSDENGQTNSLGKK